MVLFSVGIGIGGLVPYPLICSQGTAGVLAGILDKVSAVPPFSLHFVVMFWEPVSKGNASTTLD